MTQTQKKAILTSQAPQPIGPYSQAIQAGNLLFCSGQIPLDPTSGELVGQGDVEAQTKKVMENLSAVLKEADCNFDHVVKTTIFIKSMDDFPKINSVYQNYFGEVPPARACVEVARLPKDVLVEVDAVAVLN